MKTIAVIKELDDTDRAIVSYLKAGLIQKEIALRVGKSFHTVSARIKKIKKETGASSIAQMIVILNENNGELRKIEHTDTNVK